MLCTVDMKKRPTCRSDGLMTDDMFNDYTVQRLILFQYCYVINVSYTVQELTYTETACQV